MGDGNIAYELDGSDGKDRAVTVLVTAEGKVVEVETELNNPANVPAKVLAAVKAKWPTLSPTRRVFLSVATRRSSTSKRPTS